MLFNKLIMINSFEKLDLLCNNDCRFWQPPPPIESFTRKASFVGRLKEVGRRTIYIAYLTDESLYFCSESTHELVKWTVVKWKVFEIISETPNTFQLSNSRESQCFVTEFLHDFEAWRDHLSRICVLRHMENDYDLSERIGKGGTSTVYSARDKLTRETYAVKMIRKASINTNAKLTQNVVREIECLRKLNHPNIIKLLRVYDDTESISLILELLPGSDLLKVLRRETKFNEEDVQEFMYGLLSTVKYIHSKHIVHRDLKPENIIICSDRLIDFKIIDFGLAAYLDEDELNLRCGSPGYVAPEILRDQKYSEKVDIFSAGVVAYVALTKHSPFPGNTIEEILQTNCDNSMEFPSYLWSRFSSDSVAFVKSLTTTNPTNRPSARKALLDPWLSSKTPPTCDQEYDLTASSPARVPHMSREFVKRQSEGVRVIDLCALSGSQMEDIISNSDKVSINALNIFSSMTKDSQAQRKASGNMHRRRSSKMRSSSPSRKGSKGLRKCSDATADTANISTKATMSTKPMFKFMPVICDL